MPFPVPTVGLTFNQLALLLAVHEQSDGDGVTVTPAEPPAAPTCELPESVYEHDWPACVIVNTWPPIVSVAVRVWLLVLAATL